MGGVQDWKQGDKMTVEEGNVGSKSDGHLHTWRVMILSKRDDGQADFVRCFRVGITPETIPRIQLCKCCDDGVFCIDNRTSPPFLNLMTNEWNVTVFDYEDRDLHSVHKTSIHQQVTHWKNAGFTLGGLELWSPRD